MSRASVDCPHHRDCTDYPMSCDICRHNRGKRSHFDPDIPPYYPTPQPYYLPKQPHWYKFLVEVD